MENMEVSGGEIPVNEGSDVSHAPGATPAVQKFKVKVDGQEMELPIEEILAGFQTRKSSDAKYREASQAMQKIKELEELFEKDPISFFKMKGKDFDELAEKRLLEKFEYEALSPEQRELMDLKKEKEERTKKEKEAEERQKEAELVAKREKAAQDIDTEIANELRAAGIKPTHKVVKRLAEQLLAGLEHGGMSAKDALGRVNKDVQDELVDHLAALPIEQVAQLLPKELLDGLRKHFLSQVTDGKPFSNKATSKQPEYRPNKTKKVQGVETYFSRLDNKYGS